MRPDRVVERLNIVEDGSHGSVSGSEVLQMNALTLKAREKILGDGIVIWVAFAGHALADFSLVQSGAIVNRGILYAPIGMKD
jgi:hypothetical protein